MAEGTGLGMEVSGIRVYEGTAHGTWEKRRQPLPDIKKGVKLEDPNSHGRVGSRRRGENFSDRQEP